MEAAQAVVLFLAALTAFIAWMRIRGSYRGAYFWLLAAAGTTYLAVDEQ